MNAYKKEIIINLDIIYMYMFEVGGRNFVFTVVCILYSRHSQIFTETLRLQEMKFLRKLKIDKMVTKENLKSVGESFLMHGLNIKFQLRDCF